MGLDFAAIDAAMFAEFGVDAIKHDNCVSVANTTATVDANYAQCMRLGKALHKASLARPVLYDVVLQVATERQTPWLNNYGAVSRAVVSDVRSFLLLLIWLNQAWSPEAYGGKEKMHELANLWWSLPCNKYDCWECCVGPHMNTLNTTVCNITDFEASRNAMRGIMPMVDAQVKKSLAVSE